MEEEEDIASVGTVVQQDHFVKALDQLQEAHSDTIGAPKVCACTDLCCVFVSLCFQCKSSMFNILIELQ